MLQRGALWRDVACCVATWCAVVRRGVLCCNAVRFQAELRLPRTVLLLHLVQRAPLDLGLANVLLERALSFLPCSPALPACPLPVRRHFDGSALSRALRADAADERIGQSLGMAWHGIASHGIA